jgi:hypothetical protein
MSFRHYRKINQICKKRSGMTIAQILSVAVCVEKYGGIISYNIVKGFSELKLKKLLFKVRVSWHLFAAEELLSDKDVIDCFKSVAKWYRKHPEFLCDLNTPI